MTATRFRVRYGETDQMGVAYHPNYLVWCEMGRTDLIRQLGMSYAEIERRGHFLAVAEASVRYIRAARYDDQLRVDTWLEEARSRTITFRYEVHREAPEPGLLATARTTLVSIDGNGGPRKLPLEILDRFRGSAP